MKEVATIMIHDVESSGEAVAIIRPSNNCVSLCLSLKSGGDVDIVMDKADTEKLVEALKKASLMI